MDYLRESFDYDHKEGCLRWKALDEDYVYIVNGKVETVISSKSRMKPGSVAGSKGFGEYKITHQRDLLCGLRMIWQHVTGDLILSRIRTIDPRETRFSIDNLYVVPNGQVRVHRDRAKNSTVVSYSYERQQFAVVSVDGDYNKTILSYHDNIDDATEASKNPEVSFL